jgi:GTPase
MDPLSSAADNAPEPIYLVGVQQRGQTRHDVEDSLDELAQLTGTAGGVVVGQMICRQDHPAAGTFIGSGKAAEIAEAMQALGRVTALFDDDLTPAQGRNLEKIFGTKVIDRTQMILDIFAQHARTKEGCLQIELAQLDYLLPRLRRMWTHLERQKGGIGMHGPGESQLETDRRRIQERMTRLRKDLEQVRRHRQEIRRGRRRHGWAVASLVGYTNAGKSTLLNRLTDADVKAYDQLFATLDPTTRAVQLPDHQSMLLTDTVGFIRKLPHGLVESFKATLEEVAEADLLIHLIDASHPNVDMQIEAVHAVLEEIGAGKKPILPVLNKIDRDAGRDGARRLSRQLSGAISISARTGEGIEALLEGLCDHVRDRQVRLRLRIPAAEGKVIAGLHEMGNVLAEKYDGDMAIIEVYAPAHAVAALAPYQIA